MPPEAPRVLVHGCSLMQVHRSASGSLINRPDPGAGVRSRQAAQTSRARHRKVTGRGRGAFGQRVRREDRPSPERGRRTDEEQVPPRMLLRYRNESGLAEPQRRPAPPSAAMGWPAIQHLLSVHMYIPLQYIQLYVASPACPRRAGRRRADREVAPRSPRQTWSAPPRFRCALLPARPSERVERGPRHARPLLSSGGREPAADRFRGQRRLCREDVHAPGTRGQAADRLVHGPARGQGQKAARAPRRRPRAPSATRLMCRPSTAFSGALGDKARATGRGPAGTGRRPLRAGDGAIGRPMPRNRRAPWTIAVPPFGGRIPAHLRRSHGVPGHLLPSGPSAAGPDVGPRRVRPGFSNGFARRLPPRGERASRGRHCKEGHAAASRDADGGARRVPPCARSGCCRFLPLKAAGRQAGRSQGQACRHDAANAPAP